MSNRFGQEAEFRAAFAYAPETGLVTWRACANPAKNGTRAGTRTSGGYRAVVLNGRFVYEHRLAFLLMEGAWPPGEVDHANRDRADNRWGNLRHATRAGNAANRTAWGRTGVLGVFRAKEDGVFVAKVRKGGREIYLGRFRDIDDARAAYATAARDAHGEFFAS